MMCQYFGHVNPHHRKLSGRGKNIVWPELLRIQSIVLHQLLFPVKIWPCANQVTII